MICAVGLIGGALASLDYRDLVPVSDGGLGV